MRYTKDIISGATSLHVTVYKKSGACLKHLLDCGCDLQIKDDNMEVVLQKAKGGICLKPLTKYGLLCFGFYNALDYYF